MHFGAAEDAIIREHYIVKNAAEIGAFLGCGPTSVACRAKQIMRMDPDFRRVVSERVAERRSTSRRRRNPIRRHDPAPAPAQSIAVEPTIKRRGKSLKRCAYYHYEGNGVSKRCKHWAIAGTAWCPECAARIAELRASA